MNVLSIYNQSKKRKLLRKKLKIESRSVRAVSLEVLRELEQIMEEFSDPQSRKIVKSGRKSIREGAKGVPVFLPTKRK